MDLAGRILKGRYAVTRTLGKGGMGVVYEGLHLELGRPVAIKVIGAGAPPNALRRFRQEALAAAAIQHPNVVAVTDLHAESNDDGRGDGEDPPFLVMELLEGRSLAQVLAGQRSLSIPQAVSVAAQMLEGLAAAHDRGIVHRDVKPANVFLLDQPGGRWLVKILDFGIAKLLEDEHGGLTTTGAFVGTPSFSAPEQILGGTGVDGRTDVHAVSATLFMMLTGLPPFRAPTTADLVAAILRPERPRVERPGVPPALADVVLRGMAREQPERWPSARAMVEALRPFLDERASVPTLETRPAPAPSPETAPLTLADTTVPDEVRPAPRKRALFLGVTLGTLAIGVVATAIALFVLPFVGAREPDPSIDPAPQPSVVPPAPGASSAAPTASPSESASLSGNPSASVGPSAASSPHPPPHATEAPPPERTWAFQLASSQNVTDPAGWLRVHGAAVQATCGRRRSCYEWIEVYADGSASSISWRRHPLPAACDRSTTDCLLGYLKKHPVPHAACARDAASCSHTISLRPE